MIIESIGTIMFMGGLFALIRTLCDNWKEATYCMAVLVAIVGGLLLIIAGGFFL